MKTNLSSWPSSIKVILSSTALLLMSTFSFAQSKIYASNQTNQISGICLACNVENPQNAVGSNENDYSALKIGIGLNGKVEQTLSFPVVSKLKAIIGIGTLNNNLAVSTLKGVTIETFLDNISNNDKVSVNHEMLKINSSHQGSIEINPIKRFNRIKIVLDGKLLDLNDEFRIYYAYLPGFFTECGAPPLNPLYYYSFNGNTNDAISDMHLIGSTPNTFQNGLVCGQALEALTTEKKLMADKPLPHPIMDSPKTISFWARVENSGNLRIGVPGNEIIITPETAKAAMYPYPVGENDPTYAQVNNTPGQLNHYVVAYDYDDKSTDYPEDGMLCIYKNGVLVQSTNSINVPCIGHTYSFGNDEAFEHNINLVLNKALIDELIIYDRKLTPEEIRLLFCSYDKFPSCPPPSISSNPDKIYASGQASHTIGFCGGCSIQNPQNAVGANEEDYSSLIIPVGETGKTGQSLIFPATTTRKFRKVVIGIGTSNLSPQQLSKVSVETFLGNTSNNDLTFITDSMLKIGTQLNRGTIEFIPQKSFDRVRIYLNNGYSDIIAIYYAYHVSTPQIICGTPPANPIAYYPFDGNLNDTILGLNLVNQTSNLSFDYVKDLSCDKMLVTGDPYIFSESSHIFKSPVFPLPNTDYDLTLSFWAEIKTALVPSIQLNAFGKALSMDSQKIHFGTDSSTLPGINHYALRYTHDSVCLYINGNISDSPSPQCLPREAFEYQNKQFEIHTGYSTLDQLIIYDRALSKEEIENLASIYGTPAVSSTSSSTTMKATLPEERLIITPNPTTGQITLDGNILLLDSEISIRNTSGMEMHRFQFRSKTFNVPSTMPGGVYLLTVQTKDGKKHTRKFILTR
ncbi:T9SS type A sorting domain-containing protein [Chryseobacterium sp. StRB126]|uniref:T9SS type A sorting domain-containing protein n=1 Tax=Chryseobacterium sp. StRB126 TaxID=878220 RepID=UPI000A05BDB8|nr:T9SS type A sorting domain-containing protein [Chryseobacterium sp. StRB126]